MHEFNNTVCKTQFFQAKEVRPGPKSTSVAALPTHEVSKDVHAAQIGVFAASVHVATSDRLAHLVRIRVNRQDIIC